MLYLMWMFDVVPWLFTHDDSLGAADLNLGGTDMGVFPDWRRGGALVGAARQSLGRRGRHLQSAGGCLVRSRYPAGLHF